MTRPKLHYYQQKEFNLLSDKFNNLNFHPSEVVSRYSDSRLSLSENYPRFYNLRLNKFGCLNTDFIANYRDMVS